MTAQLPGTGLIKGAAVAILAQYAIASAHHVYGGLVYDSPQKLMTPLILALPLVFTLASLHRCTRPEANAALGSATNDAGRQVGAALGIAVLGALTNAVYASSIADPASRLSTDLAAVAARSVTAALLVADQVGGPSGDAFCRAAMAAFTDGFRLVMFAATAMMAAGYSPRPRAVARCGAL